MSNIACRSLRWVACWRKLSREHPGKTKRIPSDVRTEAVIAERVLSDVTEVNGLGSQVPYNRPNCGGGLWEIHDPSMTRYRCHTGHSFTSRSLLTSQSEKIEETLWVSLRMFEERKNLLNKMAAAGKGELKRSYAQTSKRNPGPYRAYQSDHACSITDECAHSEALEGSLR